MKNRILLPLICMAISIFAASCSSEAVDYPEAKEQMITLSVSAGTEDDATTSRAVLVEKEGSKSPWKWETGDQLMLVITNAGQKTVHTLKLKSTKRDGLSGEFEGQVPASRITENSTYRFFYIGRTADGSADRTISASEISAGKFNIDLTQQTGELKDLKRNCVLMGTGKVVATTGGKAVTVGSVTLKNLFAVAHFAITAADNTQLTKVGLRGKGVYASANVDLGTGAVTGVSEIGTEVDPETNIFFNGKTNFYVTFVPGSVAPSFDGYYAGSYTTVVTATPETRNYDESKSFVYYNGQKAKFSVSDNQQVAITNGNMQYVMPIATYTSEMKPKTLTANTLIRWKNSVPLKLTAERTVHPGYYRLAPEQWEMAMPRNGKTGGTYTYSTVEYNGDIYLSPETYRYFDLPSWGTLNNPTLVNYKYTGPTYPQTYTETQYDYGNKLYVGSKKTRVLTAEEWEYLFANGSYKNSKRTWGNTPKWAKCFIDENGDKVRNDSKPAELRGFLIFPDNMPIEEAKKVFTRNENKFGNESNSSLNATTYEKIKKSGAVFLPLTAYRNEGQATLTEWGQHGNYSTSTYQNKRLILANKGMYHVRFTINGIVFSDDTVPGQGCASRLVQNY
ncbi:MAG: hypothetical protein HXN91_04295 [Prevotella pallens]|jgi:hypothetical protein|nr:hypothetical protein [Prevotella pallens]MBF1507294.1 hypothetical protein [Prevotella pallens]